MNSFQFSILFATLGLFLILIDSEPQADNISIPLSAVPAGSFCVITRDSHDSWVSWSPDDRQLAFISAVSGENNLYVIKIDELRFLKSKHENFYVAEHLTKPGSRTQPYIQKTNSSKETIEGPEWSPDGKRILVQSYDCSTLGAGCKNFKLLVYDLTTNSSKTVLESAVSIQAYCWLNDRAILSTTGEQNNRIYRIDLESGTKETVFESKEPVMGFALDDGELIIATKYMIGLLNQSNNNLQWHKLPFEFKGTKINGYSGKIILTGPGKGGPAVSIHDLRKKKTKALLNSYDYEPSLSNAKQLVAFLSESLGGILIKKL